MLKQSFKIFENYYVNNKKSELMIMRRARTYGSSCSQIILVYFHPFNRNSLFCSQKLLKKSLCWH